MLNLKLKDLREDHDWTQKHVAGLLNISRSAYSAYENGANSPPLEILINLSTVFHTSVDSLLGLTEKKAPYPRKRT